MKAITCKLHSVKAFADQPVFSRYLPLCVDGKLDLIDNPSMLHVLFLNCKLPGTFLVTNSDELTFHLELCIGLDTVHSPSAANSRGTEVPLESLGGRSKSEAYASFPTM